jgi:hypothetical protein
MSSIYVACGGSTDYSAYPTIDPDGVYTSVVGGYDRVDDPNYTLRVNGSYWELIYNDYLVLYRLYQSPIGDPISTTSWTAVVGSSPVVKTFDYASTNTIIFNQITLTEAGTTAVNGTYTWNNAVTVGFNTGDGTVVSGYLHSSGLYIIRSVGGGGGLWEVRLVYSDEMIYESELPGTEPPIGSFTKVFSSGELPTPTSSFNASVLCGTSSDGNFFIRRFNNQNFIDFRNSISYIRKS